MVMAPFDQSSHSFRSEHQPEQSSEPDAELEMRGNKGRDESGNSHQERYVVDGLKYDGEPALPAETTLEHILSSLLSTPTFPTIVQPAITSSVNISSVTPITILSTLSTMPLSISTPTPTPISISTPFELPFLSLLITPTSTLGRKGVTAEGGDYKTSTMTTSRTSTGIASSSTALTVPTAAAAEIFSPSGEIDSDAYHPPLSATAEHALIAAGTIGAVILIGAAIWFILRILKIDILTFTRRNRHGNVRQTTQGSWDPDVFDGKVGNGSTSRGEKFPSELKLEAFVTPIYVPPMANPTSAAVLARADTQRQKLVREALRNKPLPFGLTETGQPTSNKSFYTPQTPAVSREPSRSYRSGPNQRVSDLSSLSSGFGDAEIDVPESGPTTLNSQRKSLANRASQNNKGEGPALVSRFSWTTITGAQTPRTPRVADNRDTIYTTTSEETAPRFRTVHSWVNQQSSRVQRMRKSEREVEEVPDIPMSHAVNKNNRSERNSNDPAFAYHPGDEIQIQRGSRVPSVILNRKFGI